jgi:hypothetical protein
MTTENNFQNAALKLDGALFETAPRAGAVLAMTWISWAVVLAIAVADVFIFRSVLSRSQQQAGLAWVPFVPVLVIALMIAAWFCSRIQTLALSEQALAIRLTFWNATYDLAGLQSVEARPNATGGTRRIFGNGGFGALHGYFHSKHLGKFRAYVTDPARCVVLRWADAAPSVVVSPKDPESFIAALCKRTGARSSPSWAPPSFR